MWRFRFDQRENWLEINIYWEENLVVFSLKRIVIYLYQEDIMWALIEGILALGGSKGGTWQV
jgi:hypothetical protein